MSNNEEEVMSVFLKLWSADHRWYTEVRQAVRGGSQEASEEKAVQKIVQTLNE
jgi:hypothetical protein